MSIKSPKNRNFLAVKNFDFSISRTPKTNYFVQSSMIPGITSGEAEIGTPFTNIKFQPDRLVFSPLEITMICDEDMESWEEISNWLVGITYPQNFQQYKNLVQGKINETPFIGSFPPGDIYSNATLFVTTNKSNIKLEFDFSYLYPVTISSINFSTTESDVEYITFDVTFNYLYYTFKRVK